MSSVNNEQVAPPFIITKEFIKAGEVNTMEELTVLMEFSNPLKHRVFGYASEYLFHNRAMLLDFLKEKEQEAQDEISAQ